MRWILVHGFGPVSQQGVGAVLSIIPSRIVYTNNPVGAVAVIVVARPRTVVVNADCPYALMVVGAACRAAQVIVRCSANHPEMFMHPAGGGEPRVVPLSEAALVDAVARSG